MPMARAQPAAVRVVSGVPPWLLLVALTAQYLGFSMVVGMLRFPGSDAAVIWPPVAIVTVVVLLSQRTWVALAIGSTAIVSGELLAAVTTSHVSILDASTLGVANCLELWIVVGAMGHVRRRDPAMSSASSMAILFAAAMAAPAVSGILGASVLEANYDSGHLANWVGWWLGDGITMLLALTLMGALVFDSTSRRNNIVITAVSLGTGAAIAGWMLWTGSLSIAVVLLMPVVMIATDALGRRGSVLPVLAAVAGGLVAANLNTDRIIGETWEIQLQIVVIVALTMLVAWWSTRRREAEARAHSLAEAVLTDHLTGLANRLALIRAADDLTAKPGTRTVLLLADVDFFKNVNDSYGHELGDRLLIEIGTRLSRTTRRSDVVARLGGDEFAIWCPGVEHLDDIAVIESSLRRRVAEPFALGDRLLNVTLSIGVSSAPAEEADPDILLRQADRAMYRAKSLGRGRTEYYRGAVAAQEARERDTEALLTEAMRNNRFEVHYQAFFASDNSRLYGFEALLRVRDDRGELLATQEIIETAERTGAIVDIGLGILESACTQVVAWNEGRDDPLRLAVNLSARQLDDTNTVDAILGVLADTQMSPTLLVLELTETAYLHSSEENIRSLERLRSTGVRIALDDFGTGYAGLSYIQRFPVDIVKIDQSFTAELGRSARGDAIVRSVVDLAHALGSTVVAEGVESPEQKTALTDMGCELLQGYHLGRPRPADQLARDHGLHEPSPVGHEWHTPIT